MMLRTLLLWASVVFAALTFAEPAPQFVEITEEAGLDFRYVNGASGHKYMVEAVGSGAAFFDDDGDGWLDLYIVNGAPMPGYRGPSSPNAHYRNQRDGTFADVTASAGTGDAGFGMGAAVGDYDNDGDADLYVTNYGPNVLYRNEGSRRFRGRYGGDCGRGFRLGHARGFCRLRPRWRLGFVRGQLHGV